VEKKRPSQKKPKKGRCDYPSFKKTAREKGNNLAGRGKAPWKGKKIPPEPCRHRVCLFDFLKKKGAHGGGKKKRKAASI